MAIELSIYPSMAKFDRDPADKIVNGQPGRSIIHKVGSAKQYAQKACGRVCNQAKFPMGGKSVPRKKV